MKLLLDTNALFWWGQDHPRLPASLREQMRDPATTTLYSIVSLWEAALKARARRLTSDVGRIARNADAGGLTMLGLRLDHVQALSGLPMHHPDPFDHALIAQAIVEAATLVTSDRMFPRYDVAVLAI